MRVLYDLCRRVQRLAIIVVPNAVTYMTEVLFNWQGQFNQLINFLIVGLLVRVSDFPVLSEQIIEEIVARDSEEASVIVI